MEQQNYATDRTPSLSKDENSCPSATSPNLNPALSTVAVQAVFRKSRSHTGTKTDLVPQNSLKQDQSSLSCKHVDAPLKNCLSACNAPIPDMGRASASTVRFAISEDQSIKSKTELCSTAHQLYPKENESIQNTSSVVHDHEFGPKFSPPCKARPSNETDTLVKSSNDGIQPDYGYSVAGVYKQEVHVYNCHNKTCGANVPGQQPTSAPMSTEECISPAPPPCYQRERRKPSEICPQEANNACSGVNDTFSRPYPPENQLTSTSEYVSTPPCFPPEHGVTGNCAYPEDANALNTPSRPCPHECQPTSTAKCPSECESHASSLTSGNEVTGNCSSPQEINACSGVKHISSPPCVDHQPTLSSRSGGRDENNVECIPLPPPLPPCPTAPAVSTPKNKIYKDPACDPDNPYILQFQDVSAAAFMIRNAITTTPCVNSRLSRMCEMDIYLKKDFMQLTGSFKERGARYALLKLTPEQKANGIIAASLGNHALALACHGAQLGIPVTVVMPKRASLAKVSACRAYGANLIIEGDDLADSKNIALELAETKGLTYINGYDHPHVMAGQGTLGLELLEQVCDVDAIVIPVGGGGLIAGVATAAKTLYPNIKIIAVESENCPSFSAAQEAGRPVLVECKATIADGLAVPMVGVNAFASAAPLVDRTVVVSEDLISLAILRVIEVEKNAVEGAGAAGIAAIMSGQLDDFRDKRVVILACGGNIDVSMLGRCLERGMIADGRFLSFTVFTDQNPTCLSDLFGLLGRVGASIKDMAQDRRMESENFFLFSLKITVETPGAASSRELRTALSQMYKKICFHHDVESISCCQPLYPDLPIIECPNAESNFKKRPSIIISQCNSCSNHRTDLVRFHNDGSSSANRNDPSSKGSFDTRVKKNSTCRQGPLQASQSLQGRNS